MDKNSKLVTSLFIILALLALVALAISVNNRSSQSEREALVPDLAARINEVDAVRIVSAGNELVADIRRTETGWNVSNAHNYPADLGKLRSTLLEISQAVIVENTTALEANYARLGVQDIGAPDATGVRIEIDGLTESPVKLIVGNTSSGNTTFSRLAGASQSWRVTGTLNPHRRTLDWLSRELTDIPAAEVLRLNIAHADGETTEINKVGTDFELAGKTADQTLQYPGILDSVAGAFSELEFDTVMPAVQLNSKQPETLAVIALQTVSGLQLTASATTVEDEIWLTLEPAFDADLVTQPVSDAESSSDNDTAIAIVTDAESDSERLAAQFSGWAYKVPTFKSDWMLKRNSDLLQK